MVEEGGLRVSLENQTVAAALQVKQTQGSESKILEDPTLSKSQSFPSCAENMNSISSWDFEN